MTRRPRSRLPPRLPDPEPPRRRDHAAPATTPRGRLIASRVTGPHTRLGKSEVAHAVARLASGADDARLGLDLGAVTREEAWQAIGAGWGWAGDGSRALIEPDRTLAGFEAALARLQEVAARGGRVAAATGCPASLLPLVRALVSAAADSGAEVLACDRWGPLSRGGQSLWWYDGVAVVTDGVALLADRGREAGPEWLFATGRPDLVVADGGFAAAALAAGHETVVLADLDEPAFGLVVDRGLPARLVPIAFGCPPSAYLPLVEMVAGEVASAPIPARHGAAEPVEPGVSDASAQLPHSTTRAPEAYAHPESGGEG